MRQHRKTYLSREREKTNLSELAHSESDEKTNDLSSQGVKNARRYAERFDFHSFFFLFFYIVH